MKTERCPMDAKLCAHGCTSQCKRTIGLKPHQLSRTRIYGRGWPTMLTTDGTRELNKDKPHIRLRYAPIAWPETPWSVQFMSGGITASRESPAALAPVVSRKLRTHKVLA